MIYHTIANVLVGTQRMVDIKPGIATVQERINGRQSVKNLRKGCLSQVRVEDLHDSMRCSSLMESVHFLLVLVAA